MYSAAAGAIVAQAAIDNIANNLANVSTAGFKQTLLQVESQPTSQLFRFQTDPGQVAENRLPGVPTQTYVGQMGSGSQIYATPTTYQQGQIATNGNSLSFALAGPGFFAIRNPQNNTTSYTRNGDFLRSGTGLLVTAAGDEVLDQAGNPITLPPIGHIEVDAKGVINVNGVVGDQIGTYEFTNLQALEAQGTGTYTAPAAAGVRPAQNTTVIQYAEEKSNADVITSIVGLISNERWFDANEKSISTQDDATNQAISIVGKSS